MTPSTASGHEGRTPLWPRVGVAVLLRREGRVLLGRRTGETHGRDSWQCPGGHLEAFESVEACAVREVREETGLDVRVVGLGPYTNDLFPVEGKHYVTLFVLAADRDGECTAAGVQPPEPVVCEPDKCAEWRWFAWDALPTPLFPSLQQLQRSGYRPT
jgi:8-oxo-dGTP diphosphatase